MLSEIGFGHSLSDLSHSLVWGVPKPGCFKAGCLRFLCGGTFLRSFAPFFFFLFLACALFYVHLCPFCIRSCWQRPRLGILENFSGGRRARPIVVTRGSGKIPLESGGSKEERRETMHAFEFVVALELQNNGPYRAKPRQQKGRKLSKP